MSARYAGTRSHSGRMGHGQELARLWPRSDMLAVPAQCAGHPLAPSVCAGPEGHSIQARRGRLGVRPSA